MKQITFIGFGEIGGALSRLAEARARIVAWDTDPSKTTSGIGSVKDAVAGSGIVFLCVPSWVVRDVAISVAPHLAHKTVVISLAKGLERDTLKTMDRVLEECLAAGQPSGVLGGPLLAEELDAGLPGVGVVGSRQEQVFVAVRALFAGTPLRVEYTADATAVALSSVLKNIYAVVLGIADGFGWGWNAKGYLAARSLEEMEQICRALGLNEKVVRGSAGAGDLLATSFSQDSFNRETGRQIALTGECKTPSEGCRSAPFVLQLLGAMRPDLPILYALDQVLSQHADPKRAFGHLFASA